MHFNVVLYEKESPHQIDIHTIPVQINSIYSQTETAWKLTTMKKVSNKLVILKLEVLHCSSKLKIPIWFIFTVCKVLCKRLLCAYKTQLLQEIKYLIQKNVSGSL